MYSMTKFKILPKIEDFVAVLNDHSKVYSMDKDLSYGKHMVTMG